MWKSYIMGLRRGNPQALILKYDKSQIQEYLPGQKANPISAASLQGSLKSDSKLSK